MPEPHSKMTIVSMAVVAAALTALLHEGVGHGVTAWLRGDIPTELTSNHLSTLRPDTYVDAGGTLVNLAVGAMALTAAQVGGNRANLRYFWWILAAFNLFSGAGYFMFSGISNFGDWADVIRGWPHHDAWRVGMTTIGAVLYVLIAKLLAVEIRPFVWRRGMYNLVGRLPYLAGCLLTCAAGLFDPLGLKLLLVSTIPAALGGPSGLLWLDSLMPRTPVQHELVVKRQPAWWVVAAIFAIAYVVVLGRGLKLAH
jgi:hypothetical protein